MCIVVRVNILLVWSDGCCLNFEINKLYRVIFVGRVYAIPSVCLHTITVFVSFMFLFVWVGDTSCNQPSHKVIRTFLVHAPNVDLPRNF